MRRLKTDQRKDIRELTDRTYIYKGEAKTTNISAKELAGFWVGWTNNITLEIKGKKAQLSEKQRKSKNESGFSYDSSTGILTLEGGKWNKMRTFQASFNGKVLTLSEKRRDII